ncbi:hypothetical protein HDU67_000578, partial [Dinochytrium kinnereticum]
PDPKPFEIKFSFGFSGFDYKYQNSSLALIQVIFSEKRRSFNSTSGGGSGRPRYVDFDRSGLYNWVGDVEADGGRAEIVADPEFYGSVSNITRDLSDNDGPEGFKVNRQETSGFLVFRIGLNGTRPRSLLWDPTLAVNVGYVEHLRVSSCHNERVFKRHHISWSSHHEPKAVVSSPRLWPQHYALISSRRKALCNIRNMEAVAEPSSGIPSPPAKSPSATVEAPEVSTLRQQHTPVSYSSPAEERPATPPPLYWDITIVPNTEVLYRTELPELFESKATFVKTKNSIKSHDPRLEYNPDELFRYFITHIKDKPTLLIDIKGTHQERIEKIETYTDNNGNTRTKTLYEEETFVDFEFSFDLTSYVSDEWSHIVATDKSGLAENSHFTFSGHRIIVGCGDGDGEERPLLPDSQSKGWRPVLEEFTQSRNWFKEIHLAKEIPWDYDQLKTALERAIRWTGYQHSIDINFRKNSYKVSAFSPSLFSHASQSNLVKCLCFLSCLWVIALPVYAATRKRIQGRLQCVYPMLRGGQEFYERNAAQLVEAVTLGMRGAKLVAK